MILRTLVCFLLVALSSAAHRAEGATLGAGLRLGAALPSPGSLSFLLGAQVHFPLLPGFATTGFIDRVASGVSATSGTSVTEASTSAWILGGSLQYEFGAGISAGLATGVQAVSSKVDATNGTTTIAYESSKTAPFLAPLVAYEQAFGIVSLTGEIRYLVSLSGDNPNVFSVVPGVKFAF